MAQRVMDCADAGHILLSQHVADDLAQYWQWSLRLHQLGECEVKHGMRVSIVNLYTGELGNPAAPGKFQSAPMATVREKRLRPKYSLIFGAIAAALVLGILIFSLARKSGAPVQGADQRHVETAVIPEKSIAVLPFENLSEEKPTPFSPWACRMKSSPDWRRSAISK